MIPLKSYLTAVAFALAGSAVHANAAAEKEHCGSGVCFQLTPLAKKGESPAVAENGYSRTPQGMQVDNQTA